MTDLSVIDHYRQKAEEWAQKAASEATEDARTAALKLSQAYANLASTYAAWHDGAKSE